MKQTAAKQYAKIRPLLPVQRGNVWISTIDFINAVLHVLENGCKRRALPERFGNWSAVYARSRSGVLGRLFAALREQEAVGEDAVCFGLDSASAEVHPDGTGARKTNGPQSIGKSRGGWYAKIHMVSASGRQAMIFRLSDGQAHDAPEGRALPESWADPGAGAPLATDPPARPRPGNDAGRAAEGEPESRMELRPGNLQDAERDRTSVPEIQRLPTHLHAVRQARRDVSGLREPRCRRRNDA